ncbi:16S rRNA (uracil(1498)-N(3))-methyltransferase [Corynebacterium endometrii]|uniref:Ribosomal RNA small subunit methyltransferase E n=1 Tax=Corynebacterium endometrii TaxID=2488819 RepID=A0A4P7QGR7_9CORY|nr:16S rRNA (uracil(1498)-N(3))-methyltransferase [Corynebacterium endometrii]QCB28962.1 Ribosomal RNA small subunit methyltransferase E [Corynebacterium endometrii]
MSLPVFIHPGLGSSQAGQPVYLSGAEGRHAVTVKRIHPGERINLIDGTGATATVTVTKTSGKDQLTGTIESVEILPAPSPRVVVVQAIPKAERSELAIDLATQAGADEIIAWQADRCVAKWDGKKIPKAVAKWEAAAQSAAKQARRSRIPAIRGPLTTKQLAQELTGAISGPESNGRAPAAALVLHEDATESMREVSLDAETIYLIVGPEGGIGEDELATLRGAGSQAIKLGPEVLRTASAAMVALAAIGVRTSRW